MLAYRQLGLFREDKIDFNDFEISPREFYHFLLEPQIYDKNPKDVCIMRTQSMGESNGQKKVKTIDCIEFYDEDTGFLAMEKWTGFHASMVMQHIINGEVGLGAHSIENAMTGSAFYNYAIQRGYDIKIDIR